MLATQQDATAAELENIRHNNLDTNHDHDRNSVSSHGLSDTEYRSDDICDMAESLVVSPPTGHPADLSRLVDNSIHFGGHILHNVTHPQPQRDALLIPENNGHPRIDNMPVLLPSQSQSASFMFPSRLQVTSQQDSADVTVPTSIPLHVPQYGDLAQSLVVSHAGNPIPVRQLAGNTLHPATPHASPTVPNVTPLATAVTSHGHSHINEVSAGLPSHQPQSVHFVPSTVPLVSSQLDNPDKTVPHSISHQTAHYRGVAEPPFVTPARNVPVSYSAGITPFATPHASHTLPNVTLPAGDTLPYDSPHINRSPAPLHSQSQYPYIMTPAAPPWSSQPDFSAMTVPTSTPHQASQYNDLSKFLIKKDLLLTRLRAFTDTAETYLSWKNSFRGVMSELSVTPSEELDLLIKFLGRDSSKWAVSLKSSNAFMPDRAVCLVWERLDERFGRPEFVEAALKTKLSKFPRMSANQYSRLYDLADILAEIDSVMEDPSCHQLFAYFNTSSGIKPVVAKLPSTLQNKWLTRAMHYKSMHRVAFPPFSEFCRFVHDMSRWYNDPAFSLNVDTPTAPHKSVASRGTQGQPNFSSRKTEVSTTQIMCPLHPQGGHELTDCRAFRKKSLMEHKKILRENHYCFKCCTSNSHQSRNCTVAVSCGECKSERHPTALHVGKQDAAPAVVPPVAQGHGGETATTETPQHPVTIKCTQICGSISGSRSCSKTVPVKIYQDGRPDLAVKVYAVLDDQSNGTLGRSELFDAMDVPDSTQFDYTLTTCSGKDNRSGRRTSNLVVESLDGNYKVRLPDVVECNDIPDARDEIPTPEVTRHYKHLHHVYLPPLDDKAKIQLLIGRDVPDVHIIQDQHTGPSNTPFAQRLSLGWVIIGDVCLGKVHAATNVVVRKTYVLENGRPTTFEPCPFNLTIKEKPASLPDLAPDIFIRTKDDDKPGLSVEDRMFISMMDENFKKNNQGHWEAPLPFRPNRCILPNNKPMALKRANNLHMSLSRNEVKKQHFVTFMKGMLERGHAEVAPLLQDGEEVWYLPVFGVYHPKKKDKIRIVFDSSATYQGLSLNKVLMTGPDLINNLIGVLLRFRKEVVAVIADIEQMFYGFYVAERHRNFLRFLWHRDNDPNQDLIEYRMCVHVFGNSPSPAVATYGLRRCVQSPSGPDAEAVCNYVLNNFYVDDGLASFSTASEAIRVLQETQETLHQEGKIRLHKIASNCQEVLKAFPAEDLASDLKNLDLLQDDLPSHFSLGLCWNISKDAFVFKIPEDCKPCTRRGTLSTVISLFDSLGFLAPITVQGKILLQDINAEVQEWDDPLSQEM